MNIRTLLLSTALLVAGAAKAQLSELGSNPFMSDANGRPMYLQTNYRSEGSPFYHDAYFLADLTSIQGKVYPKIKVKLNVQTNELLYMAPDGTEMIAALPVRRIRFLGLLNENDNTERILESATAQPLNTPNAAVYELVDSGHVSLLKLIRITYSDNKEFNQSSIVRNFKRKETWHLRMPDGTITKFETGKDALLTTLKDKQKEVADYIEKEGLKCRSVDDCHKVLTYYNSLF